MECELVRAQNALIVQSLQDERGKSNPDGWGLGTSSGGEPCVERQVEPAYESETFRWAAARVHASHVLAHVRRATVGRIHLDNTHPFAHAGWMFAHNGTVNAFAAIRPHMLEVMTPEHRDAIQGDTDSEHFFHLLLSLHEYQPAKPLLDILRKGLHQVIDWSQQADPDAEVALNILWSADELLVGSRLGRSLWFVQRKAVHTCDVCGGELHVDEDPGDSYRAVVVASEKITATEDWTAVPESSCFRIDSKLGLTVEAL